MRTHFIGDQNSVRLQLLHTFISRAYNLIGRDAHTTILTCNKFAIPQWRWNGCLLYRLIKQSFEQSPYGICHENKELSRTHCFASLTTRFDQKCHNVDAVINVILKNTIIAISLLFRIEIAAFQNYFGSPWKQFLHDRPPPHWAVH